MPRTIPPPTLPRPIPEGMELRSKTGHLFLAHYAGTCDRTGEDTYWLEFHKPQQIGEWKYPEGIVAQDRWRWSQLVKDGVRPASTFKHRKRRKQKHGNKK